MACSASGRLQQILIKGPVGVAIFVVLCWCCCCLPVVFGLFFWRLLQNFGWGDSIASFPDGCCFAVCDCPSSQGALI